VEDVAFKPVFALAACKELVLSIPFPPLLIDLSAQIMTWTTISIFLAEQHFT
jgi:hypothetical protein